MSLLRKSLLGNGLFSSFTGMATVVFASGLAVYMSISPVVLYVIGVGTALFGVMIFLEARRNRISEGFALFVITADISWVFAAMVVLAIPGSMQGKWLLAAVSAVVALFAVLQSRGLLAATRANPRRLVTEVSIGASPEAVWRLLTDLESYPEWNPFMIDAYGEVTTGAKLHVRMQPSGGRAMTLTPTVTEAEAPIRFQWLGHLAVPGLFDGRHSFELEGRDGGTRLIHSEEFTGLLVSPVWGWLDGGTRAGFEAMNEALRDRAEVGAGV